MPDIYDATKVVPDKKTRREKIAAHAREHSSILRSNTRSSGTLGAYCPMPTGVGFDLQHEDETVLMLLRQHPIVNVPWVFITILLVIAPAVFLPLVPILDVFPVRFRSIALLGWYVIVFGFALQRFLIWFFNIYIITDERVIDMDFYNLLFKRVSEAKTERIEDITTANSGLLQSIIDFGDVQIQTAAEIPEIEFESIPHPDSVQKLLSELIDQEEQEKIEGRVR